MGRPSVSSKESGDTHKDFRSQAKMDDGNSGKTNEGNPQAAMNDFLSNPAPAPPRSRREDEIKQHDNSNRNSAESNKSGNYSNSNDPDEYDYEMQDYMPQPFSSRGRSMTSYVPQYTMASSSQFPIQEVVPNTQMAISTSTDTSGGANGGLPGTENARSELRPRGPTVSSNVRHFGDFFKNSDDASSHHGSVKERSNIGSQSQKSVLDPSYNEDPRNALMMVKPKTLYQNPQTPTVLPSTYHPINKWSTVKHTYLKEFLAEFLGTTVMITFGSAIVCQVVVAGKMQQNAFDSALDALPNTPSDLINTAKTFKNLVSSVSGGTFDGIALGWAAAVVMGYFAAGGSAISGAHLNPSLTVASFVFRGFPAKKVPYYLAGQLLGGFCGALILFIFYKRVLEEAYEGWWMTESVAGMFCVFPKPYLSSARQFVSEFICTFFLQVGVFSMTDPYTCLSTDLFPLMLFLLIYMINASMCYQTGNAMNMARDLGPRLALYALGFNKDMLWKAHHHFFWVPMVAPFLGSITGGLVYDICIYQGHESPVNWPLSVYKDMLLRAWFRRPGWTQRTRARATSELSDFSYDDDDEEDDQDSLNPMSALKTTKTADPAEVDDEPRQKAVQFKSVQGRGKRYYGGVPTILEDENSIEAASLGGAASDSMIMSDTSSIPGIDDITGGYEPKKQA